MEEKGEGSGGEGGGKWGRRGREVGGKGEGTGNGVPPCPPPLIWLLIVNKTEYPLSNIEIKKLTERCRFNHLADQHIEVNSLTR